MSHNLFIEPLFLLGGQYPGTGGQHHRNIHFEPTKARCSISHPLFEEYRMLSFVNNIKIKTSDDDTLRVLSNEEKQKIIPVFFRKSKPYFDFEDIAKQLAPKKQYKYLIKLTLNE